MSTTDTQFGERDTIQILESLARDLDIEIAARVSSEVMNLIFRRIMAGQLLAAHVRLRLDLESNLALPSLLQRQAG